MLIAIAIGLLWVALSIAVLAACRMAARGDELDEAWVVPGGSRVPAPAPRRGADELLTV